jgi:hypothetical protein
MQFCIIGFDGQDAEALKRRLAVRDQHIALSDEAIERGEQIMGAAIIDDNENMCGSIMIVDFPSQKELEEWLDNEPYVTGEVWEEVQIIPVKVGPSFEKLLSNK